MKPNTWTPGLTQEGKYATANCMRNDTLPENELAGGNTVPTHPEVEK